MKLEQKFEAVEPNHKNYLEGLVEVADEFAIDFARWLRKNTAQTKGGSYKLFNDFQQYNLTELIEIFKNQNTFIDSNEAVP
jgi:hypothetical protein